MKKILLSLFTFAVIGFTAKVQAQCDLTLNNLQIQIVGTPVVLGPNKCEVTFNAQFDIAVNGGFKVLYFHSWLAADYPATPVFDCGNSNAQDAGTNTQLGTLVDDLGKSFLDMGFTNVPTTGALNVVQPLTFSTTYVHDNAVVLTKPSNSPGLSGSKYFNGTADHYTINNIKVIINSSCASTIAVKTDIWGSNSNAPDPKAQCYICALPQFFNDPTVTGFKNCSSPRQYAIGINTVDPTVKTITYKVYLDANSSGVIDGGDILAYTSGNIQISAPGGTAPDGFSSGLTSLPSPYSNTQPYSEYNYIIVIDGPTLTNSIVYALPNPGCFILPVDFKSFTAVRNMANVDLKWETATEQNSSGFAVERNTNGAWQQMAFVPSQAVGGSSNSLLTYHYSDFNNTKGITLYRIKQVELDGKSKYSEIRSVRGDGQKTKTIVYPNPSFDGKVNVAFDDAKGTRDVSLMDASGRIIKQWKAVTGNTIQMDNLVPGMYSLRIVIRETGEQTAEKIVVNNR